MHVLNKFEGADSWGYWIEYNGFKTIFEFSGTVHRSCIISEFKSLPGTMYSSVSHYKYAELNKEFDKKSFAAIAEAFLDANPTILDRANPQLGITYNPDRIGITTEFPKIEVIFKQLKEYIYITEPDVAYNLVADKINAHTSSNEYKNLDKPAQYHSLVNFIENLKADDCKVIS